MNSLDETVARLEADWPEYQIWWVPRAVGGGPTWHARRWDAAEVRDVIHADSSEELAALLGEQQEAGQ